MRKTILVVACALLPLLAQAQSPEELRQEHRAAAQKMFEAYAAGVNLSGTVEQNESEGEFEAWFFGDEWYVSKTFGDLTYFGYGSPDGHWLGSNFSLPFALDAQDHPADTALDLLSSGKYLEEPWWEYFTYLSEDAGGYNFVFDAPDLPRVNVVLYSDPGEPQYLQLMSSDVPFAETDPDSLIHRSYIYYEVDETGQLMSARETGRDLDKKGNTVNFTDYVVTRKERLSERPAILDYTPERVPVGGLSNELDAPVAVPVLTEPGYFLVPLSFSGSAETFWFVLDTGSSASLFTQEAAEAAAISDSLNVSAHGHGTTSKLDIGMCTTASVGEAGAEQLAPLAGFPVTTIPDDSNSLLEAMQFYGASGILGVSLLHQYVVTFDDPGQELLLYPPRLFSAEEHIAKPNIEFWLDVESLIFTTGTLNGTLKGDVVIDTGLQQELALLRETVESAGLVLEKVEDRKHTVLGGAMDFEIVAVDKFELGPIELTDTLATMTSDDRGDMSARGLLGFIGVSLFKGARITLDLFGERMYVENVTAESEPETADGEPLSLQADEAAPDGPGPAGGAEG